MLVRQNADNPATAQQLNRFAETFAALKDFHAKSTAGFTNVSIDVRIANALINGRGPLPAREMREQSGAKLPGADVTQEHDERLLLPEKIFDVLEVFQAHALQDFFHRHSGELHAAKQIRSQPSKMLGHDPTHLFFGKFVAESDTDIVQSQPSVVRQE